MPSHASTLNLTVTCVRIVELTCKILAQKNFHIVNFLHLQAPLKYVKFCTMKKFPAIQYRYVLLDD